MTASFIGRVCSAGPRIRGHETCLLRNNPPREYQKRLGCTTSATASTLAFEPDEVVAVPPPPKRCASWPNGRSRTLRHSQGSRYGCQNRGSIPLFGTRAAGSAVLSRITNCPLSRSTWHLASADPTSSRAQPKPTHSVSASAALWPSRRPQWLRVARQAATIQSVWLATPFRW